MMNSLPSVSDDPAEIAGAYDRLDGSVKQWIWDQGWTELRDTQARAVAPILDGHLDVIISAATASGKTEAAWLPIISALAAQRSEGGELLAGVKALYVSPLKALINDQYNRLQSLCELAGLPINRRHGDVVGAERRALSTAPDGVLLITPESLEALFVLQGTHIPAIFATLSYVVIDEMHSFIGSERGAQLQSLLNRIELATRRRIPRIGLSATFADFTAASDFIRPNHGPEVCIIDSGATDTTDLQVQLRGYVHTGKSLDGDSPPDIDEDAVHSVDKRAIADHLFSTLRGKDNLVFANSRAAVEAYTDLLEQISVAHRVPNEFMPHHGNLSKQFREVVERRLKAGDTPTTAVCTSTLEMGIDIGSADSVAQIGSPNSVSALRQRLGRSGRRGQPSVLRIYVSEPEIDSRTNVLDRLRSDLFQATAIVELMLEKWYEPPNVRGLHLSTLIQQVLSVIAQHSGAFAKQLFSALCSNGPFRHVTAEMFTQLLRDLAEHEIIIQSNDGTLLPGRIGEVLLNHYSFYAAFQSVEEYRLMADSRVLGTIPVDYPVLVDSMMIFAGKRWRVVAIDAPSKTIQLTRAAGGKAPMFHSSAGEIADGIRQKMRHLYESDFVPPYLDQASVQLLQQGRSTYLQYNLAAGQILQTGNNCVIFPWRGSRITNTISVMLTIGGIKTGVDGLSITCHDVQLDELYAALADISAANVPDGVALASEVTVKVVDKNDQFLGESLLDQAYAARDLDPDGATQASTLILDSMLRR
jgi:ATP-dependent Lhr-like helicase